MYEDLENIKADRVSTVVFNLHQIKRRAFFFGGGDGPGSCLKMLSTTFFTGERLVIEVS